MHSRDITYAVLCKGPFEESFRYRDFMGWDMPWYSAEAAARTSWRADDRHDAPRLLCPGRRPGVRDLLTTGRGVEIMDNSYHLMDITVYGRQEPWKTPPNGDRGSPTARVHSNSDERTPHRPVVRDSKPDAPTTSSPGLGARNTAPPATPGVAATRGTESGLVPFATLQYGWSWNGCGASSSQPFNLRREAGPPKAHRGSARCQGNRRRIIDNPIRCDGNRRGPSRDVLDRTAGFAESAPPRNRV